MYADARDFFNAARKASQDADTIGKQLDALEHRALGMGGGGFEPRVRSTPDPDRMGLRVSALIDHGGMLERRQAEDYRLIDAACRVLYGPDDRGGLYALVGWPEDAIYHHYLALRTWEGTAAMLGYSVQHVRRQVMCALDLADANGQMWTELGRGLAT